MTYTLHERHDTHNTSCALQPFLIYYYCTRAAGLDAASAFFVMDTIRALSLRNRTVLTVIHQPSSEVFELSDQVNERLQ